MSASFFLISAEFILLLFSAAFFSGSETAITAITHTEYRALKKSRNKKDKKLLRLIEIKDKIVTTTLIGTNAVNMLLSSLVTAFTINNFGSYYVPLAAAITTVCIILFAEIIPKAIAACRAVSFSRNCASMLGFCCKIIFPLVAFFSFLSNMVIAVLSGKQRGTTKKVISEDQLKDLVKISREDGAFETSGHILLNRAIHLRNIKIRNIMKKRADISYLNISDTNEEIIKTFRSSKFSRLPVLDSDNNVFGLVHYKDILFYMTNGKEINIKEIMKTPIFIPETVNIFSVIKAMNAKKRNMAFVIDEHGYFTGLITMDDAVSAILGKTQDEYSHTEINPLQKLKVLDQEHIRIPGDMQISQLNDLLNTDFSSLYYDTVGGLILEKAEYLPDEGTKIEIGKMEFTIEKIKDRKIVSVKADIKKVLAANL